MGFIAPASLGAQILDKRAILERQTWWDNRDWPWYERRIPFFESPDPEIDATYYYRWEVVTKHLVYGSPASGYTFTEFIDRPFWSGAYGAISCPLGHQHYEVRWLKDRRIIDDFARYWFETPGAQPRSYSNWYGDAMWATYLVNADTGFLRAVLPHMKAQYAGWVAERYDSAHGLFRWDGMHDGMEYNINSRQTTNFHDGAEGYRPTLNSYLFADALAISRASALFGDSATSRTYAARAAEIKRRVQDELWDQRRGFFLHQFARDEQDGIRAKTRTYDSGKYAGNPHGRELIGYVPWQFNLPDPGYESAWRFLMDTAYFFAPYGPTTTERHDPLFVISERCCWWSGNSWPYATTQTLVAMANLINNYTQTVVDKDDWVELLKVYTRTQRLEGRPYIAEAANPDNGSWDGHNHFYHSEHYFHSGYTDLVITGLVGLRPRADDTLEVNPLIPDEWAWFALDDVAYHGRTVSIVWDRDGTRYRRGAGLTLYVDGRRVASAPRIARLLAPLGAPGPTVATPGVPDDAPADRVRRVNVAVNNDRGAYPWLRASFSAATTPAYYLIDGNYWYHASPPNRWTATGSPNRSDTLTLDLGVSRQLDSLALFFLDDGTGIRPPARYDVQLWNRGRWTPVTGRRSPSEPTGRMSNSISFPATAASKVRFILTHRPGSFSGLTELEAWSRAAGTLAEANVASPNHAFGRRVSASFTSRFDRIEEVNDMRVGFSRYSRNRWTAFGSPNTSDWLEVDLGVPQAVTTIELYLYDDGRGVRPPKRYTVQYWNGSGWDDAMVRSRQPEAPTGSAVNTVRIERIVTSRMRIVFEHALPGVTGVTELMIWSDPS